MFTKVLIANRGEIAVRVARTCREMGIATVAVHSTADHEASVVRMADEAVQIGPGPAKRSYLSIPAIIEAARTSGAQAIHPGYGFLSEDPDFAEVCAANDVVFVGPRPDVMRVLGDKSTTRAVMQDAGLPLLPGTVAPVGSLGEATAAAAECGYPVILKAVAGGGGRGMSIVERPGDLAEAFARTRSTAAAVFGDARIYLERYVPAARHVEVQVLCDNHGNGIHLGDRDCSAQRRHQKLVEEAPAPNLPTATRDRMRAAAVHGALSVGFSGAGTMEFLVDPDGGFYLMEMNARLQVEHPVTEMVTGIDLVEQQLRIAAGQPLALAQTDIGLTGHSIECRINAEDPEHDFRPTPGPVERCLLPGGPHTRVDTHVHTGHVVPSHYDSLLAKVVTWGPDRATAVARTARALAETDLSGARIRTTTTFAARIVAHPEFRGGHHTTELVAHVLADDTADVTVTVTDTADHDSAAATTAVEDIAPSTPHDARISPPNEEDITMTDAITPQPELDAHLLREILVSEVGLDDTELAADPDTVLADLGLDSMAQVELGVVLRDRHGITAIPDATCSMSFGQLADELCGKKAA